MDSNFLFCYPKLPYLWYYKLNEKTYSLSSKKLYTFCKTYLNELDYLNLNNYINKQLPFLIDIKNKKLELLKKQKNTNNYYKNLLFKELSESWKTSLNNNSNKTFDELFKMYCK